LIEFLWWTGDNYHLFVLFFFKTLIRINVGSELLFLTAVQFYLENLQIRTADVFR